MVVAHIFGMPIEETLLPYTPVILAAVAGGRLVVHRLHRKVRQSPRRPIRDMHT